MAVLGSRGLRDVDHFAKLVAVVLSGHDTGSIITIYDAVVNVRGAVYHDRFDFIFGSTELARHADNDLYGNLYCADRHDGGHQSALDDVAKL